ncbi:uncharacterized protein BDZ83DRAFT_643426 [Colletotrichum acutatum]|uniref:Uncharacterized protein n=1 Tax=Glomerella acutata TaxID=27357 RepID=A0AAD8XAX0_GLOAC|nr:uncharacterized protein BDZ83DRAFT_643426 [Colletotrichum acutatum]KAK1706765.1 hypothetical protein BDZ83DRAFT_643426 [Colletotrichum acutatum]
MLAPLLCNSPSLAISSAATASSLSLPSVIQPGSMAAPLETEFSSPLRERCCLPAKSSSSIHAYKNSRIQTAMTTPPTMFPSVTGITGREMKSPSPRSVW